MGTKQFFKNDNMKEYNLPIRWDGKSFYKTLYELFKKYIEDIKKYAEEDKDLQTDVEAACMAVRLAVNDTLKGLPSKAFKDMADFLDKLYKEHPLKIDEVEVGKEWLFRVRDAHDGAKKERRDIFHTPFGRRSRISTARYSILGFPSLYLGTDIETCFEESGCSKESKTVIASRFELQTGLESSIFRAVAYDDDLFKIVDFAVKPKDYISDKAKNVLPDIDVYLRWYPVIASCSYIRVSRNDPYAPEYSIPQIVTQWVRSSAENSVCGIRYFSCASDRLSEKGYNYVFPSRGVPSIFNDENRDYCPCLSHRFKLTEPRFIHEFDNITACGDELKKDGKLDYLFDKDKEKEKLEKTSIDVNDGVCEIGAYALSGFTNMTNVKLPESLVSIGNYAFAMCINLSNVKIPKGVESIGEGIFGGCSQLKTITVDEANTHFTFTNGCLIDVDNKKLLFGTDEAEIPDDGSVTSIGNSAFSGCSLPEITIPKGVTSIGNGAFSWCNNLTKITIPEGVTSIGSFAFDDCRSLTKINIPEGVTSIGSFAFDDCRSLTKITIPEGVTSIGNSAFRGCSSLSEITIPEGVTSIGDSAFYGCRSLPEINIPDGVTSIGRGAFYDCKSLKKIIIPESVTSIGNSAFSWCDSLTEITLPQGVTSIGKAAFQGCSQLKTITVDEANTHFRFTDGCLISLDTAVLLFGNDEAKIPNDGSVTSIGDFAFFGCSSLTEITIPESVTSIGKSAFRGCSQLKTITVDEANTHFKFTNGCLIDVGNKELLFGTDEAEIPDDGSVTRIGNSAFCACRMSEITIPESVMSIGYEAFAGCKNLSKVTIKNPDIEIADIAFWDCPHEEGISESIAQQREALRKEKPEA